ncbi:MAG: aminoacyl-tRNA hydrolase [Chloroflexia bacterium]|nr:aminoacyl-tRNA hydrolase [Chloroflexia bacterium]
MRIVIGLGNPGRDYAATRHNVGYMVVDELARRGGGTTWRKRFRSEIAELVVNDQKWVLVKPQTFMNLSGHAAREVVNWYHVPQDNLLVIHDDLDLPFGILRLRARGSAGGHNGMKSLIELLGGSEISRLKVGVGRGRSNATAHVLARFSPEEEKELEEIIERASNVVLDWSRRGILNVMNEINQRAGEGPAPSPGSETRCAG